MRAKPFFDTNIPIYALATGDPRKPAAELPPAQGASLSVQISDEFANVSNHKLGLGWDEISFHNAQVIAGDLAEKMRSAPDGGFSGRHEVRSIAGPQSVCGSPIAAM